MRLKSSDANVAIFCFAKDLKRRLIAQTARGVAGIAFALAENGKVNSRGFQNFDERSEGSLIAHVECAFACDEQKIDGLPGSAMRHIEIDGPVVSRRSRVAALSFGLAQITQRFGRGSGHLALREIEVAAHADDRIDVLDQHRALFDTCPACRAGPHRLGFDELRNNRFGKRPAMRSDRNARIWSACIRYVARAR